MDDDYLLPSMVGRYETPMKMDRVNMANSLNPVYWQACCRN